MTPLTLDQLQRGHSARITSIAGDGSVRQRLMAIGLLPGATVTLVGVAPMGDPITIQSRNGRVSLRKTEARALLIEPLATDQPPASAEQSATPGTPDDSAAS